MRPVAERERSKRLFVAVNLSLASTRRIADVVERLRRAGGSPRVAWVPAPNLHVTLKFLGWTRADAVAAVKHALAPALEQVKPFEVEAVGGGAFPSAAHARILWVGVRDPSGALGALAGEVEARMEAIGYAREARAYHPHVTIGRVKEPGDASALLAQVGTQSFGTSRVSDVTVYESTLKSTGSEYTPLFRLPLERTERHTERQTRGVDMEPSPDEQGVKEPDEHGRHGS
jgi:2'-5' RNA ligase